MTWSGYSEQGTGSQERGPGSFSVDVPGVPTQQGSPQFVPIRAGGDMRTDGSISVPGRMPQDSTLTVLAKMGQEWLAPKIEAEKDRLFLEGMHRAAAGVAVQEIAAEQSTLSKLFGEAPAVEGARAYTVLAKKSAFVTDFQIRMPDLAKVGPDQWPTVLQQEMQKHLTGDPATDAAIQREFLAVAPDLSRQYTKASYLHHQAEAKKARVTALDKGAQEYTAVWQADPATRTVDQMDKAEQRLLEAWTPLPGTDEESHMDDVTSSLVTDLLSGNFDATRLAFDNNVIQRLGPERALKITTAAERAAPKGIRKLMPQMVDDLIEFGEVPAASTAERLARWNAINDKAAGLSRIPREFAELVDPSLLVSTVQREVSQAGRSAANPEIKAVRDEAVIRRLVDKAKARRSGSTALSFPGLDIKEPQVQETLGKVFYERREDPRAQAQLMNSFSGKPIEAAKDFLQQQFEAVTAPGVTWETAGPGFAHLLTTWSQMSPAAQEKYFTDAQRDTMNLWERKSKATPLQVLFSTTGAMQRSDPTSLVPDPDAGSIQETIESHLQDIAKDRTLGGIRGQRPLDEDRTVMAQFSDEEMQRAAAITMGIAKKQGGRHVDQKRRAEYAFSAAINSGDIDIMGGRLYLNEDPDEAREKPLRVGVPAETAGMVLDTLITEGLKKVGVSGNNRTVIRVRGTPITYVAVAVGEDGKEKYLTVTEDEVRLKVQAGPVKITGSLRRDGRSRRVPTAQ